MAKILTSNSTRENMNNITIVNDDGYYDAYFRWFRCNNYDIAESNYGMKYDLENDILGRYVERGLPYPPEEKWQCIKSKSKIVKYGGKINLKEASIALMNLNVFYDNYNEIIAFYKKYGPLGLMPYYISKGYDNPIEDLISYGNAKFCFTEGCNYNNYWSIMFGVHEECSVDVTDTNSCVEIIREFNEFKNENIYSNYREPLWLTIYTIREFQLYCRSLIKDKKVFEAFYKANYGISSSGYDLSEYFTAFNYFNENIKDDVKIIPHLSDVNDIQLYAPSNSLFQSILIFTTLTYMNIPIEKCKNPTCFSLFWKDHNRSKYCSDACKSTVGGRNQRNALSKKVKEYIQRKYHNSSMSTEKIYEIEKKAMPIAEEFIRKDGTAKKSVLEVLNKKKINEWLNRK